MSFPDNFARARWSACDKRTFTGIPSTPALGGLPPFGFGAVFGMGLEAAASRGSDGAGSGAGGGGGEGRGRHAAHRSHHPSVLGLLGLGQSEALETVNSKALQLKPPHSACAKPSDHPESLYLSVTGLENLGARAL
jgi:hypothetical protein